MHQETIARSPAGQGLEQGAEKTLSRCASKVEGDEIRRTRLRIYVEIGFRIGRAFGGSKHRCVVNETLPAHTFLIHGIDIGLGNSIHPFTLSSF